MNIDFPKLIKLLLPTFMRAGLTELVEAIASPLTSLYTDFQLWQIDIRLQAAMTAQVMYMETILNYRLLNSFIRTIYITDGDGVTVDFIVNVPSGVEVDNYRLIALVEKYKASGKRYSIGQSALTYEVLWTDAVCELISADKIINMLTADRDMGIHIFVVSEFVVTTEISVDIQVTYNGGLTSIETVTIPLGSNTSNIIDKNNVSSVMTIASNPAFDDTYIYDTFT